MSENQSGFFELNKRCSPAEGRRDVYRGTRCGVALCREGGAQLPCGQMWSTGLAGIADERHFQRLLGHLRSAKETCLVAESVHEGLLT
jgi:hypothetical protein